MLETMYAAPGVGLAAPQVGIQKRMFVYDAGEGPAVVINPRISESQGSGPSKRVAFRSLDFLGRSSVHARSSWKGSTSTATRIAVEAEEYLARVYQHEVDHLDGVLLIERLDPDQRKQAMRTLRQMTFDRGGMFAPSPNAGGRGPADDGGAPDDRPESDGAQENRNPHL